LATRLGIRGRNVELYVRFVDAAGNPVNADTTPQVEIYDSAGTRRQASTNVGVSLVDDPGLYKFDYEIPLTGPDGYWSDTWAAVIGNETVANTFEFETMSAGDVAADDEPDHSPGDDVPWDFTKEEIHGINILMKMVKSRVKNDGVRSVPDGEGGVIEMPCVVFTDDEIICFLYNSLSTFNEYPHFTQFIFADPQMYTTFSDMLVQGAVLLALAAQALIERGREFSIRDNGVTYQTPQKADILNTQYSAQLADYKEKLKMIKCSMKPDPRGLGTFRVTSINPNFLRLRHLRERQII